MARRGAALEGLDDDHAAAATRTRVRGRLGLVCFGAVVICGLGLCRQHGEQFAGSGDVVGSRAAGEQAVVTDTVEAVWQDVDQEAADELADGQYHDLLAITTMGTIVLPSEGDAVVADCDQSAGGDGD